MRIGGVFLKIKDNYHRDNNVLTERKGFYSGEGYIHVKEEKWNKQTDDI